MTPLQTSDRKTPMGPAALALTMFAACSSAAPPRTEPPAPVPQASSGMITEASFTVQQVDRGANDFRAICGDCHSSSEFRGTDFQFTWRRRTAWDFYKLLTSTMPENAPGSLMDEQYVDVTAYILQMNGFEAGENELVATQTALDQFVMDAAPNR